MISDQQLNRTDYSNTAEGCGLHSIAVRYFLTERIPDYISGTYRYAWGTVSPIKLLSCAAHTKHAKIA
jgi:hypothetical protein